MEAGTLRVNTLRPTRIVAVNREIGGYDEVLVYFNRLSDLLFVLGWSMEVMAVVDGAVQEVISSAFK